MCHDNIQLVFVYLKALWLQMVEYLFFFFLIFRVGDVARFAQYAKNALGLAPQHHINWFYGTVIPAFRSRDRRSIKSSRPRWGMVSQNAFVSPNLHQTISTLS